MLRAAVAFFVLALVAMLFGATGFAGVSMDIGKTLLIVFLVLAVVSFIANLLLGRKTTNINGFVWFALILGAGFIGGGCDTLKKEADVAASTPSSESVTAAREANASHVAEVNFEKGSFVLTEGNRVALADLVKQAKASGKIDDIKVLAWADAEYPASGKEAPKAERDLAEKRADAISKFVKAELDVSSVDTLNMAQRPGVLSEMFNTSDSRLKKSMENAGVTSNDGKSITGQASRAVVMVMLED